MGLYHRPIRRYPLKPFVSDFHKVIKNYSVLHLIILSYILLHQVITGQISPIPLPACSKSGEGMKLAFMLLLGACVGI